MHLLHGSFPISQRSCCFLLQDDIYHILNNCFTLIFLSVLWMLYVKAIGGMVFLCAGTWAHAPEDAQSIRQWFSWRCGVDIWQWPSHEIWAIISDAYPERPITLHLHPCDIPHNSDLFSPFLLLITPHLEWFLHALRILKLVVMFNCMLCGCDVKTTLFNFPLFHLV